jgi:5-deoxy-glucuronate isomerase
MSDRPIPDVTGHAVLPSGTARSDPYLLEIRPESAGWRFSGLRVVELPPGASHALATGTDEVIVLPLAGACSVTADGNTYVLAGRDDVFAALTDFLYVPISSDVEVTSEGGGRFALLSARADRRLEARHVPADRIPVELRGAGPASRQVNNFCAPDVFDADRLIAVEVLTPAGNWSSYPPHKHDEDVPGIETILEEIYYFEVADSPSGDPGFAYQRVYTSGPGRDIDITAEVRSGDAIVMPHGYHGPSMAAPGYDLYYLNVMAGPGERAWRFTDDPGHAWIRDTWQNQQIDPRLPMTSQHRQEWA